MSDDEMYESLSDEQGSDFDMADGTQDSESDSSPVEEDVSDDDYDFETVPQDKGKSKMKTFEIQSQSLSPKDLETIMHSDAEYISNIFGVDTSTAYVLLRSQAWNKERLVDNYMEDPAKILTKAGVAPQSAPAPFSPVGSQPPSRRNTKNVTPTSSFNAGLPKRGGSTHNAPASQATESFMCPICCDDEPDQTLALGCGHTYCSNCWSTYLHTKIHDEGEVAVRCMNDECQIQANDDFVRKAATQTDSSRYMELLAKDYIANTPSIKFCPHPGCVHALSCPDAAKKGALVVIVPTVNCVENHEWCFGCGQTGGHRPVICVVAKMWLKKCRDDSETANWIKSNTKECPKCQSTIEKNGGCNHMTCKKCKYEFCWVCMGNWTDHGSSWYSCNRYEEKEGVEARDAQSKSRASLERYLHYYNRWANHEQSARLSLDLYAKTEKKMEEMQVTSNLTWIEVQFARKAVDEIIKCRMTLKWTYAMAYYLEKTNQKELFEDNQADLEKAVEDLSELLEQPIEPETIGALRQKMTDKTVYVAKRNEIVLEDTAKGFQDDRWVWNVDVPKQ